MTVTDIQCDQCGRTFQPKRVNKAGPCYCGNACRQKAHRLKVSGKSTDSSAWNRLVADLEMPPEAAKIKQPGKRLQVLESKVHELIWQRDHFREEAEQSADYRTKWLEAHALSCNQGYKLMDLMEENANLRKYNKAVNTKLKPR